MWAPPSSPVQHQPYGSACLNRSPCWPFSSNRACLSRSTCWPFSSNFCGGMNAQRTLSVIEVGLDRFPQPVIILKIFQSWKMIECHITPQLRPTSPTLPLRVLCCAPTLELLGFICHTVDSLTVAAANSMTRRAANHGRKYFTCRCKRTTMVCPQPTLCPFLTRISISWLA
jgi:hypothetical protein